MANLSVITCLSSFFFSLIFPPNSFFFPHLCLYLSPSSLSPSIPPFISHLLMWAASLLVVPLPQRPVWHAVWAHLKFTAKCHLHAHTYFPPGSRCAFTAPGSANQPLGEMPRTAGPPCLPRERQSLCLLFFFPPHPVLLPLLISPWSFLAQLSVSHYLTRFFASSGAFFFFFYSERQRAPAEFTFSRAQKHEGGKERMYTVCVWSCV